MRHRFQVILIAFFLGFLITGKNISGQNPGALMMLPDNFHAQMANPSYLRDDEAIEIAVPALGGVSFVHSGNFKISDLIVIGEAGNPELDLEHFYKTGNTKSLIRDNLSAPVFFYSQPFKKGRVSVYYRENMQVFAKMKMKAVEYVVNGNISPGYKSFSTENIDAFGVGYREFTLGYAWRKNKRLNLGGHVKLLFGSAFIELKNWEYEVETAPESDQITLISVGTGNMSIPVPIELSENQRIIRVDGDGVVGKYFRTYRNPGMAVDLGATYKISKKQTLSVAVNNLGGLWFRNNTVNLAQQENLIFNGFDLTNAVRYPETGTINPSQLLMDTKEEIRNVYRPTADTAKKIKALSPEIILNYTLQTNDWLKVGFTNQTELRNNFIWNTVTFSAMQSGASFSVFEHLNLHSTGNLSFGGGFQYEARYFQVFLSAGNIIAYYHPAANKTFSLQGGLCFLLNHEKIQKPSSGKGKGGSKTKGKIYPWRPFYRVKK